MTGKSNWFRGGSGENTSHGGLHQEENQPSVHTTNHQGGSRWICPPNPGGASTNTNKAVAKPMPNQSKKAVPNPKKAGGPHQEKFRTATVLFVEQTRGGSLAKEMKGVVGRLTPMLGARIRVVERGVHSFRAFSPTKTLGKEPNVAGLIATLVARLVKKCRTAKQQTLCMSPHVHCVIQRGNLLQRTWRTKESRPAFMWEKLLEV